MYWIHVYNHEIPLGSFYTSESKREDVANKINEKHGKNNWTRFTSECN